MNSQNYDIANSANNGNNGDNANDCNNGNNGGIGNNGDNGNNCNNGNNGGNCDNDNNDNNRSNDISDNNRSNAAKFIDNVKDYNVSGARTRLSTSDLALIALFVALMTVCSWISIPMTVPFTLQTFGVFLAVGLLGGRRGIIAVLIYLCLGAVGIPVFSGFTGGIGHMLGPTGGYIIGFIFSAQLMWLAEELFGRSLPVLTGSMIAGLLVCYAFGTAWFMIVYTKNTGDIGLKAALAWCVIPYIIPDVLKIALATLLIRRLRPFIR